MNKTIAAIFLGVLPLSATLAAASFAVQWQGSLKSVHGGDTSGKVPMQQFEKSSRLFALGPAGDLDGEITVLDGKAYISRVRNGEIKNDNDLSTKASFLVWSEVPNWGSPTVLQANIGTHAELEKQIEILAKRSGVDTAKPFPFLIEGNFPSAKYHILSPKGGHSNHGNHTDGMKSIQLKTADARVLGFFSKSHEGVFTHKGSVAHLHIVEPNGNSGHVDEIALAQGARVLFPKPD